MNRYLWLFGIHFFFVSTGAVLGAFGYGQLGGVVAVVGMAFAVIVWAAMRPWPNQK